VVLFRVVDELLSELRPVFRREASFSWFIIVAWGFLLRGEAEGVTSIVRCFGLAPSEYFNLLHFFHSSAFSTKALCRRWVEVALKQAPLCKLEGSPIYLADGIVADKTGKRMPGVKKLRQEPGDNRPEFLMGHFWGALTALLQSGNRYFALPLRLELQDGIKRSPSEKATTITRMGALMTETVLLAGTVVADTYYACKSILQHLRAHDFHFIGRVRMNTVAYEQAARPAKKGRGRPSKLGKKVVLRTLFDSPKLFVPTEVELYGKAQKARLCERVLYWQGLLLKFVLSINEQGQRAIFVSTHLELSAPTIVTTYSLRFKIEAGFKSLAQVLFGFCYRFWMKAMPKRKRTARSQYLHRATDSYRRSIRRKLEAYERFVNIAAIALGILQVVSLRYAQHIHGRLPLWFRTVRQKLAPSENLVRSALQAEAPRIFATSGRISLLANILRDRARADFSAHPLRLAG
jgi:hypothetical protein